MKGRNDRRCRKLGRFSLRILVDVGKDNKSSMLRDIPVGNGNLLIIFDQDKCLRDIYYPNAGKENHTGGHKFRFGIWVDGQFDWVKQDWGLHLEYDRETLITRVTALNERLAANLQCQDLFFLFEGSNDGKT